MTSKNGQRIIDGLNDALAGRAVIVAPKVGDIRESGGKIWRCYEVELEGAKFELIGEMANEHPTDHHGDGT